ncbi:hypothetical protein [Trichormus azollae]|jgi:hypothetical protein|uniref:hypothetical protein n=1 Tax=Trichormus azollae TaxID=1164 RepID=UPI0001957B24|nr:hypothetical protein [Trichormus azollae]
MPQTMISEAVEEINNDLENLAEDIFEITDEVTTSETIFSGIVNFFKKMVGFSVSLQKSKFYI